MTPRLTKQQRKVFDYIRAHRGCTTKDIMLGTGVQCPSGRVTEIRQALEGSSLKLVSIGQRKYPGSKAFERYAIEGTVMKRVVEFDKDRGVMVEKMVAA
ncbi:hypothetical protein [uncultured Reyranella sp.]|uniref:hypothetical protein n=1 Tax=uncultured Reyranella sp. TaxID=735512 RepID=UPI0025E4B999|nr:hypothetical protein [uncultured Reyranella sp.]